MHALFSRRVSCHGSQVLRHFPDAIADPYPQAGLEHYEVLDVMAVEQALAELMRRCAALPEQAPPSGDSDDIPIKAAPKIGSPSEPIIPADMKLPRCAQKASWALKHPPWYHSCLPHFVKALTACRFLVMHNA